MLYSTCLITRNSHLSFFGGRRGAAVPFAAAIFVVIVVSVVSISFVLVLVLVVVLVFVLVLVLFLVPFFVLLILDVLLVLIGLLVSIVLIVTTGECVTALSCRSTVDAPPEKVHRCFHVGEVVPLDACDYV